MTPDPQTARTVKVWLEDGRTALPDHVLDAVLDQIPKLPQRHPNTLQRRFPEVSTSARIILASAAVVLAVVGAGFLPKLDPDSGRAPGTSAEAPTPAPTTSATPAPSQSPTTPQARLLVNGGLLDGGTYLASRPFLVPFELVVPGHSNWFRQAYDEKVVEVSKLHDAAAIEVWWINELYADPCRWRAGKLDPPAGPSIDELAAALAGLPGITAARLDDATIDGHAAKVIAYDGPASAENCDESQMLPWVYTGTSVTPRLDGWGPASRIAANERGRIYLLEVNGLRLAIRLWYYPENEARDLPDLESILASIRFK